IAVAVARFAHGSPNPVFADAVLLDVAPLDAAKAYPDAARQRRLIAERACRIHTEPVGRDIRHPRDLSERRTRCGLRRRGRFIRWKLGWSAGRESLDALGQARNLARGRIFVNDALLRRAGQARLGLAQRLDGGLRVLGGDRLLDLADIGAHLAAARLVDGGPAAGLAGGF